MSSQSSRRSASIAFLLVAAIVFQTVPLMNRAAFAQKRKPVQGAPPQPVEGAPVPNVGAPTITATKVDAWDDTATPDGKAEPGQTITYTVTITNTGTADATGVTFTDSVDPNTTLVPGSITTQPIASPDAFNVIGNVRIQVPDGASDLLGNDCDPDPAGGPCTNAGLTITTLAGDNSAPFAGLSTAGGNVTATTGDGSFQYNPAPGFAGQDTFTYTVTDGSGKTDTATVTLQVGNGTATPGTNVVWFVNSAAVSNGDGRLTSPFNCLRGPGCFDTTTTGGAADDPGDTIFLYSGNYTGGFTLLANQKLIGAGSSVTLASAAGVTVQPYSDPLPATGGANPVLSTGSLTDDVALGTGNTLRGFTIGNSGGANGDSSDITGSAFGTLTLNDLVLNGTGRALNLVNGTIAAGSTVAVTVSQSTGGGINLDTLAGSLTFSGTTSIDNQSVGQSNIRINSSSGNFTFGTTNLDRRGSAGILINAASGTIQFGAVTINNQNSSATSGIALDNTTGTGSITMTSATVSNNNVNAVGIALSANSGTISINGGAVSGIGASGTGIQVSSAGNANVTIAASVTNSAGRSVQVLNRNGGSTTLSGNINDTGTGINVANNTGGTVTFSGATKTINTAANPAVTLTTNTGATISFSNGGLDIDTTSGAGFTATGGGTVSVGTGANNNTINSTGAAAVVANGITLNATFTSVTAAGGTNGIGLTNVGGTSNFGTGALSGASGAEFLMSGGSATVSYGGTITQNTASQKAIDISGITGGTITLSGAIGSNGGSGVSLAGTGGTVTISGDMTLNNSNSVFSATGSGLTVNVTGTNNTIGATNAATTTAVTITNATIGSSGVTFKSISETGGSKAVTINNAGTAGTFTVTGTGTTAGSGGTIQNTTGRSVEVITFNKASGNSVVLNNMTFNNNVTTNTSPTATSGTCGSHAGGGDASTCGAVLFFNSVTGISLTNTTIDGTTNSSLANGIVGNNVINMTLTQVSVKKAGNDLEEEGLKLVGIAGTLTLDRCTFLNNQSRGVYAEPFTTTMNMTVSGGTFGNNTAPNGQQGILVVYRGTGGTVTVQKDVNNVGTIFQTIANHAISVQSVGSATPATVNFNIDSATFNSCNAAIDMPNGSSAPYNFNVTNNNLSNIFALASTMNAFNTGGAVLTGTFNNNTIGQAGVAGSGCNAAGCSGIRLTEQTLPANGSGKMNITVTNNFIHRVQEAGIITFAGAGSGKMKLTITGNTISNSDNLGGSALQAIHIESGALATDSNEVCVTITNNSMSGANWLAGIRLTERSSGGTALIHVPGMGASTPIAYLGCGAGSPPCTSASTSNSYAAGMAATTVTTSGTVDGNSCSFLLLAPGGVLSALEPEVLSFSAFSSDDGNTAPLAFASSEVTTSITQSQLDSIVNASIQRWSSTGLTQQQVATLHGIKFEIADLQGANLGEFDGNRILVDKDAEGEGWFVDQTPQNDSEFNSATSLTRRYTNPNGAPAGHVDLLTAIAHEMGHKLGLDDSYLEKDRDSIMYGYLTVGERRSPAFGQAKGVKAETRGAHYLALKDTTNGTRTRFWSAAAERSGDAALDAPHARTLKSIQSAVTAGALQSASRNNVRSNQARNSKLETASAKSHHAATARTLNAPAPFGAGGSVSVNVGTLAPGDSVTITFQVVIDNPYSGGPNVSNQGTVHSTTASFADVVTNDPDTVAANDPTLTPINAIKISVNDAKQAEPTSGTSNMVFTVALSAPANGAVSVNFATADQAPGAGHSVAGACGGGGDYTATSGTVNFAVGQQVKTINVPVCSDAVSEPDETFLVNLSSPTGGNILDGQATGTITAANPAGTLVISEVRTRGSAGANDDFVELYNNTNSPIVVPAGGYGVFKMGATCGDTPVLVGTVPATTSIPARGHFLLTGSSYSLANYGGTNAALGNASLTADIEDDRNIALFSTTDVTAISSTNLLDAVGFGTNTGNVCDLTREGSTLAPVGAVNLEYSYFRTEKSDSSGNPKDTNNNAADFKFADTGGTFIAGVTQALGAPGPENLAAPLRRDNSGIGVLVLDSTVSSTTVPNRERNFTSDSGNNSTFGTLRVRRRVVNNTGAAVTRLRFRVVDITTFPSPGGGVADLRARTSLNELAVGPVNDATTCTASGAGAPPCTVTTNGLTLEMPPNQTNGGGYNSTLTVNLGSPLANGASLNVNFLLGIQTTGTFRFLIIVEALP
jgi:Bacterial Ig domain/Calx-beta domain/Matrixin